MDTNIYTSPFVSLYAFVWSLSSDFFPISESNGNNGVTQKLCYSDTIDKSTFTGEKGRLNKGVAVQKSTKPNPKRGTPSSLGLKGRRGSERATKRGSREREESTFNGDGPGLVY